MPNIIIISGNLGHDPELKYSTTGKPICRIDIAVNMGRDKDALWMPVTLFDAEAERCKSAFHKGERIYVEGRLSQDQWEKDGEKKKRTVIIGHRIEMIKPIIQPDEKTESSEPEASRPNKDDDAPF